MDIQAYRSRRERLLSVEPSVWLFPSAPVALRNNDVDHAYRPDSDLHYLSGFEEPEARLLLSNVHEHHRAVMFLRPRDPEREVWDGFRVGVERAPEVLGVDAAWKVDELAAKLPEYLVGAKRLYYKWGRDRALDELVFAAIERVKGRGRQVKAWPVELVDPASVLHEHRLVKTETELELMRAAAKITCEAHAAAMARTRAGMHEFQLEGVLQEVFLRHGAQRMAYEPIVGSGPNATILHYRAGKRVLGAGEMVLIDAGCEHELYASDVTRAYPVDGKFSAPQAELYEVVLAAQLAAIDAVKPGSTIEQVHDVAVRVLVEGMCKVGLVGESPAESLEKGTYKKYYMHRTSHWLGMDVHDVGVYHLNEAPRPFVPGMVLTVEPGIYVAPDDASAPERYRGIGIRIEDDIVVTKSGYENLTAAAPKTIQEIEAACQGQAQALT